MGINSADVIYTLEDAPKSLRDSARNMLFEAMGTKSGMEEAWQKDLSIWNRFLEGVSEMSGQRPGDAASSMKELYGELSPDLRTMLDKEIMEQPICDGWNAEMLDMGYFVSALERNELKRLSEREKDLGDSDDGLGI